MNKVEVDYIRGARSKHVFGVRRYETELETRLPGIEFNYIDYAPAKNRFVQLLNYLIRYPGRVWRACKKERLTHIATQDFAYLLNFFKFKKVILTCYDLIMLARLDDFDFVTKQLIKLNARGIPKADKIVTISHFSRQELIDRLHVPLEKIEVVHPACDLKRYTVKRDREILKKYRITGKEPVVLYVGSEEPRQNVDKILHAVAQLKKEYPAIKFVKAGKPQWRGGREKLEALVKELGLEETVIFTGYVEEEELPKLYNAADVFVYPCESAGWGLPALEAMACGTPVIVSNKASLPEVVGAAGVQVEPEDVARLVKEMRVLLMDKKKWDEFSKKGPVQARTFDWDKSAKKLQSVYEEMYYELKQS